MKNMQHISSVNPNKVLMPLLHIKLGLIKNFVKDIAKHCSNGLKSLCKKFPKQSQVERRNLCWSTNSESF